MSGAIYRGPVTFAGGLSAVAGQAYANSNSYVQTFAFALTSFVGCSITSATTSTSFNCVTATAAQVREALGQALYALQQKRILEGTVTDS
jgi:hypothetical protein